ncbi:hypothetical protein CHUAL_000796 [Chamberlinius hualienensis]
MGETISKGVTNLGFFFLYIVVFNINVGIQINAEGYQDEEYTLAYINVSYHDPTTRKLRWEKEAAIGKYGQGKVAPVEGILVHVRNKYVGLHRNGGTASENNGSLLMYVNNGCEATFEDNNIPKGSGEPWIGLIKKGQCSIAEKILNAAVNNATAVIIYDDEQGPVQKMYHRVPNIVSVLISKDMGEHLSKLADTMTNGTSWVRVSIMVGVHQTVRMTNINRTSVLFVSVSFIVLMVISLAWLIFYYVQRFRYINVKDQLAKRLSNAAKKALTKIPLKTVKETDAESECCAVCIEPYRAHDVLRILPCGHQFHKLCVDPWLLEHRTCPMCKMDILKHFGLSYAGNDSEFHVETETAGVNVSNGDRRSIAPVNHSGATPSRSSNNQDPRSQSGPQTLFSASGQLPVISSIEAIKIAILENSPMASRNLRRSDEGSISLDGQRGPT